jgi:hypothetical protein
VPPKIHDRDLNILYFTWQCRFVAQRQFKARFWADASQQTMSARISRLCEAKLLRAHLFSYLLNDRYLYSITNAGVRELVAAGLPNVPEGDYVKKAPDVTPGMKHDLALTDLRIGCERGGHVLYWQSEHELRLARRQGKGPTRIVDGLFKYQALHADAWGLFEYERVGYRRSKFVDILNRLKTSSEHTQGVALFFVSETAQRAETLRQWASTSLPWTLTPDLIYFGHFEAIKAEGLAGGFVNLNSLPLALPRLVD